MPVMPRQRVTITFRNAVLIWKNFGGAKKRFNNEGDRNFSILLDEEQALSLLNDTNEWGDSWSVKPMKKRDPEGDQLYHLKVSVKFENNPPSCWLISSGGKLKLPADLVHMFDKAQAAKIDLTVNAYDWAIESRGTHGRKAYLENIYFHLYENELDAEYREVPELTAGGDVLALESGDDNGPRQDYDYEGEIEE